MPNAKCQMPKSPILRQALDEILKNKIFKSQNIIIIHIRFILLGFKNTLE